MEGGGHVKITGFLEDMRDASLHPIPTLATPLSSLPPTKLDRNNW